LCSNNPHKLYGDIMQNYSITNIFDQQKKFSLKFRKSEAEERIQKIQKIKDWILNHQEEIEKSLRLDFKKEASEVDLTEINSALSEASFAIKNLKKWMRPQKVKTPLELFGSKSQVIFEAKGVALIIGPWNYPFSLTINPLIASISAGNTSIIKPSELTPKTSSLITQLIRETFSVEEVCSFEGGIDVSTELLKLPFDHIFFTGSTSVGKVVMAAAAKNLSSVTLELGGKSPVVVDQSAKLNQSAKRIAWGKFINAGQTCVAPDYILVKKEMEEELVNKLKTVIQKFYGKNTQDQKNNKDFCRIINEKNFQRLKTLFDKSIEQGAKIAYGGEFDSKENYISPTLLTKISVEMPIMQEEIFGPILPIITYDNLDEAIELIQKKDKPLALYVFAENQQNIDFILRNTSAGGTCINETMVHLANPYLPFGGTGHSGIGSYHGIYGHRAFSHQRSILSQGRINFLSFLYPPYNLRVKKIIKFMIKYLN